VPEPAVQLDVVHEPAAGAEHHAAPLIVLHGAWHAAWVWNAWLALFAERGWDVYAPSLRGHGSSEGDLRSATLADHVDDIENLLEAIGGPAVLVGHSLGGLIIQHLMAREAPLEAVVLLASIPPRYPTRVLVRGAIRHPVLSMRAVASGDLAPLVGTDALVRESLFSADTPYPIVRATRERLGGASTALFRDMTLHRAPRPTQQPPALVVAAEGDRAFPVAAQSRLARRLDAELRTVTGGHDIPLEQGWRETATDIAWWLEQRESQLTYQQSVSRMSSNTSSPQTLRSRSH